MDDDVRKSVRRLLRIAGIGLMCLACRDVGGEQAGGDKSRLRLDPTAYVQLDLRAFPGWSVPAAVERPLRADEAELRRARLGLEGRWRRVFLYGSGVGTATPLGRFAPGISSFR
jgi:hypothetical protein